MTDFAKPHTAPNSPRSVLKAFGDSSRLAAMGLALLMSVSMYWPHVDREIILMVDTTWTMFHRLKPLLGQTDDLIRAYPGVRVTICSYDYNREPRLEVSEIISDPEALWPLEDRIAARIPANKPGTYPHVALSDAVSRASHSTAKKIIVGLITDGDTGGYADEKAVTTSARELAANSKVVGVLVLGLVPGDPRTANLERLLAPLGDRLLINTGVSTKTTIDEFIAKGR